MRMRYTFVAIGAFILTIVLIAIRFKTGTVEGFWPHFAEFLFWIPIALLLSKTVLRKTVRPSPIGFRQIAIIGSMVFFTLAINVGVHHAQKNIFGKTWRASYDDPVPEPGKKEPVVPSVVEKIATNLFAVAGEEISSRFITLTALLMVMPTCWAIALSGLLFAASHMVIPVLGGMTEVGLYRLAATGVIGIACGIAFVRYGLGAAIAIHFFVNLVGWFSSNHTYIAKTVIFGSAFVGLIVLPITLWFTRKRETVAAA